MAVSNADILNFLNANPGMDDAGIASAMQQYGVSAEQMAQATGANVADVTSRYEAAVAPTTVADLYREILGREPDAEGLAFWSQGFGDKVDATEKASFLQAASSELAKRTPAEQKELAPNFDSLAEAKKTTALATAVAKAETAAEAKAVKDQAAAETKAAADAFAKLSPEEKITKQILSQNLTSKWSGQGHGSAEANAADMAKILTGIGVTNIRDFGKVPVHAPVEEIGKKYNGQQVRTIYNEDDGTSRTIIYKGTGRYDEDGNEEREAVDVPKDAKLETVYGVPTDGGEYGSYLEPVDSSKLKTIDGKLVVDTGQTTFGNKKTGQTVSNTYGERQTGDSFGGTYAGKGNTGYRVQFTPDGIPIFYTSGQSSNSFAQLMSDLGPIGNIALAYVGGPMAVAAMGVLSGKPPEDILKSAALSYLGGQAGEFVSGAEGITDVLGDVGTNIASNAAKQFVASGGKGIDPVTLLLNSGAFSEGSGIDGPNSADFEEGYFNEGGEGFNVLNSDSTDDFLKSIGINSVDELTDSGLSNADIYGLVTGDYGDLSGLEGLASVDDDFSSTYVDGADLNLASVDEDFPSTYSSGDDTDSLLNSGTLGNISNAVRTLTGGTSGSTSGGTTTGGTTKSTATGGTTGGTTIGGTTTGGTTTGGTTSGTATTGGTTATGGIKTGVTKTGGTTTGGTKTVGGTRTSGGTRTTGGTNVAKAIAGLVTGAKTAKAATPTNPAVDAILNSPQQQQQTQQGALLNLMGGKDELANIKSYKELYGDGLFGDSYVPPSAGGSEEQGSEEEFFNGGHVNDLSIDALLHMLRN